MHHRRRRQRESSLSSFGACCLKVMMTNSVCDVMLSFPANEKQQHKKKTKKGEEKLGQQEKPRKRLLVHRLFEREKISFTTRARIDKKSLPNEEPHSSLNVYSRVYHHNKNTHYLHKERYAHIVVYFIIVRDERRYRRATTVLFFFFFFSVFVDEDERISKIHEQIWKKRKRTPPSVVKRSSQEYEE